MKRLLAALFLVLSPLVALAQPINVITPRPTDYIKIESPRFVYDSFAPISALAALIGNAPCGTAGQIQFNNGGVCGAFTVNGAATLNPATGTLSLGTGVVNPTNLALGAAVANIGFTPIDVATRAIANGVATLDSGGFVPISQLPPAVAGGLTFQGNWNANTNSPVLVSSTGTVGQYYFVSVAGSTNLNGTSSWAVGDLVLFSSAVWNKIPGPGAGGTVTSVAGLTGAITAPSLISALALTAPNIGAGNFPNANFGFGAAVTPDALVTANANSGATAALAGTGAQFHAVAANGLAAQVALDSFANFNILEFRRADGTLASKTAVQAGEFIASIAGYGWNGSNYNITASIGMLTAQNYTGSANGTLINFSTTPLGSLLNTEAGRFNPSGGFSVGTTTDNGIGTITANAGFWGDGSHITGISAGSFTGTGTAPITQTVNAKLDRDTVSAADYAVASASAACATDATTGLQNWLNKLGAGGGGKATKGYWCYTSLTLPSVTAPSPGTKITCDPGAYFVKIGATGNGFVSGNTLPDTFDDFVIRDCIMLSKTGVVPTGGSTFFFKNSRHVTFDNTWVGTRTLSAGGATKHSFNAFELQGVDGVYFRSSGAWGCAFDCVRAYGTASSFNASLVMNMQIGGAGNAGVHIGGGLGGVFCENVDEVLSGTGFAVDTTLYAVTNREFFLSRGCVMDSNTGSGFTFAANSVATILGSPWTASNGAFGLLVSNPQDTNMSTILNGALAYGNGLHGIDITAGHVVINGGEFLSNGTVGAGQGSGIILFSTGGSLKSAQVVGARTSGNSAWGVDNQGDAATVSITDLIGSGNTNALWRNVNTPKGPQVILPTNCTSQPSGVMFQSGSSVAICP